MQADSIALDIFFAKDALNSLVSTEPLEWEQMSILSATRDRQLIAQEFFWVLYDG